jgi:hypothetical protein
MGASLVVDRGCSYPYFTNKEALFVDAISPPRVPEKGRSRA